jgi:Stage II sporulation protein E (SpoIIE)
MEKDSSNTRKYIETIVAQSAKKVGAICGDYIVVERTPEATTAVLADGIGTGVKARVAAVMYASRLMELIRLGFTLREACGKVIGTMHEARTSDVPFAAFSVCRVLNSGLVTILSYEIPFPILVDKRLAAYLPRPRSYPLGLEMISETNCTVDYGDGILLVSDGVSQAGLGHAYRMGWGLTLASGFVNGCLIQGIDLKDVPAKILGRVKEISGSTYGDDTSCLLLLCREARIVNVFTGPPSDKTKDAEAVREFMEMKGKRVVCGSTTTEILARHLKVDVATVDVSLDYYRPPSYRMEGIDLACEGAVTLNQVYNILDEKEEKLEPNSPVSELYRLLHQSDTVNFFVGSASNPAHQAIAFKQMGILPREAVTLLLAQKLKNMGKLVNLTYF